MKRISCVLVVTITALVLSNSGTAVGQNFSKTATPSSGPAPLAVVYTYTFDNAQGPQALSSIATPTDDKCSPVVFGGGDSNHNQVLDVGEIWTWTCNSVITATTTNTSQTSANFTKCSGGTCSTTFLDFITTHATVLIMPAPLSVSISGKDSACKNDLVTLTAAVAGGTPPYTFAWTNGATSQTITPDTSAAGTFPFDVTVTDHAGKTASANITLVVALICLTSVDRVPPKTPQLPLLTTIEWGCGWNFAGQCLSQTIVKICVGGQCFDNPGGLAPPICKVCGWLIGVGGLILGLGAGLLLAGMRGSNVDPRNPPVGS